MKRMNTPSVSPLREERRTLSEPQRGHLISGVILNHLPCYVYEYPHMGDRMDEEVQRVENGIQASSSIARPAAPLAWFNLIALLVGICPPGLRAENATDEPAGFLRQFIHITDDQLLSLGRGQAVAKILDSSYPVEIPAFGAIQVRVSGDFLIEKYRDIASFKKSKEVLQIGKFSSPPQIQDLAPLILDQSDVDALKKCLVGDCALKLPSDVIERFRREIDRSSPDYSKAAAEFYRRFLFGQVLAYISNGNAALPVYHDKKVPVPLAGEFLAILQSSPYISQYAPGLDNTLRNFPKVRLERSEEFLYWSKEKFGYKAVISLTHVMIYRTPRPEADWTFIASKQIYANHYLQGSLGLAMFVEKKGRDPNAKGYLLYLNRSRADLPQGLFSGLIRYFVKRRVLDGTEKYLKLIKERLESEYRAQAGTGK